MLPQLKCVPCDLLLVLAVLPEARTEPSPWERLQGYLLKDRAKEWMIEQTGIPPKLERQYTAKFPSSKNTVLLRMSFVYSALRYNLGKKRNNVSLTSRDTLKLLFGINSGD